MGAEKYYGAVREHVCLDAAVQQYRRVRAVAQLRLIAHVREQGQLREVYPPVERAAHAEDRHSRLFRTRISRGRPRCGCAATSWQNM